MSDVIISFIRTIVPGAVGAFVTWIVSLGISIPEDAVAGAVAFLTALFTGLYYVIIRYAERRWPKMGWLLGYAARPKYDGQ